MQKSTSLDKNAAKQEPSLDNIYTASQNDSKKTQTLFAQAMWLLQTTIKNTDKTNKCAVHFTLFVMHQINLSHL